MRVDISRDSYRPCLSSHGCLLRLEVMKLNPMVFLPPDQAYKEIERLKAINTALLDAAKLAVKLLKENSIVVGDANQVYFALRDAIRDAEAGR